MMDGDGQATQLWLRPPTTACAGRPSSSSEGLQPAKTGLHHRRGGHVRLGVNINKTDLPPRAAAAPPPPPLTRRRRSPAAPPARPHPPLWRTRGRGLGVLLGRQHYQLIQATQAGRGGEGGTRAVQQGGQRLLQAPHQHARVLLCAWGGVKGGEVHGTSRRGGDGSGAAMGIGNFESGDDDEAPGDAGGLFSCSTCTSCPADDGDFKPISWPACTIGCPSLCSTAIAASQLRLSGSHAESGLLAALLDRAGGGPTCIASSAEIAADFLAAWQPAA